MITSHRGQGLNGVQDKSFFFQFSFELFVIENMNCSKLISSKSIKSSNISFKSPWRLTPCLRMCIKSLRFTLSLPAGSDLCIIENVTQIVSSNLALSTTTEDPVCGLSRGYLSSWTILENQHYQSDPDQSEMCIPFPRVLNKTFDQTFANSNQTSCSDGLCPRLLTDWSISDFVRNPFSPISWSLKLS